MHFNDSAVRWALGLSLNVVVVFMALRQGLYKRLPVFTTYFIVVAICDTLSSLLRAFFPVRSATIFYEYWIGQAVMIAMRALAVGEICFGLLSPYKGIWRLCRLFLAAVAVFLLVGAGYAAAGQLHSTIAFIMRLQRGLELAIVGTLAFALLFAKYYEIKIERFLMLIAGGLLFYSAVQIGNSEFTGNLQGRYHELYAVLSLLSFNIASLIWLAAVWKPVPAYVAPPQVADTKALGVSAPQVNARLRELNTRLLEILR